MPERTVRAGLTALVLIVVSPACGNARERPTTFKFAFAPGKAEPGYIRVTPETAYDKERGRDDSPWPWPGGSGATADRRRGLARQDG
jgi:hypothetical protein